jgi:hypothetical protein
MKRFPAGGVLLLGLVIVMAIVLAGNYSQVKDYATQGIDKVSPGTSSLPARTTLSGISTELRAMGQLGDLDEASVQAVASQNGARASWSAVDGWLVSMDYTGAQGTGVCTLVASTGSINC